MSSSNNIHNTETDVELGEHTPLLGSDDKPLKALPKYSWRERGVALLAVISVLSSVCSIFFSLGNPLVIASSVLGIGVAPYAVFQQQKITHVEALAETNKKVQEEVNQLQRENGRLQENVEDLSASVTSLKAQKQKLETIKSTQVGNLEDLEDQLEESQEILKNMKQNVVGEILQNMMDVVLSSDVDQNDKLDDGEIDGFIKRMEDMNNVDFNNQEVKAAINAKGGSVDAIMDLAKNLLLENDNSNRTRFFNIKKSN